MKEKIMVTQASLPPFEEYVKEIKEIWDTHWLTNMGTKHNQLEEELKSFLGINNISLFVNGHMALELLIQAMNLTGEIITTPFTFASTTHAIVRNGLTPVFCDIKNSDYTIDEEQIESLITDKTSAILPVHVYGNVCSVEKIEKIAKRHSLKVIYDAAHAFGVEYKGKSIACYGDASMFSFHATKVFNTIEGGGVCFQDPKLERMLYQMKNFGIKDQEEVDGIGANAKMNEFQASMGICNLRHFDELINKRKMLSNQYKERLQEVTGIQLVANQEHVKSNYAYLPIYIERESYGEDRNTLYARLEKEEIFARKYFYPLTSDFSCYKGMFDSNATPVAKKTADNILTLPLYPSLSSSDVDRICDIIAKRD